MELVRWNPWVLWPLEGMAVGLLAGAAAWCFDEPAAAVVDTLPRGLAWRTTACTPGLVVLLATWVVVALHAGPDALFGHGDAVVVQGVAATAAGGAAATWSRARGEATPGLRIAAVVVPVSTAWALLRPLRRELPVFPYGTSPSSDWQASTTGWVLLAVASVVAVFLVLAELGRRHRPWGPSVTHTLGG
jgi:hypothetical protein